MVEDKPALGNANRRRAAADLHRLPGLLRQRHEAMLFESDQRPDVGLHGGRGREADPHAGTRIDEPGAAPRRPRRAAREQGSTSAGGAWRRLGFPSGPVTGSGKRRASLLGYRLRSVRSCGWYANHAGPRRSQRSRSVETASPMRGPSGPYAMYVMTQWRRLGQVRDASVLDAAPTDVPLPGLFRLERDHRDARRPPDDRSASLVTRALADPRVVALGDEAGKEVDLASQVRRAGVEDAPRLHRLARQGRHDHPETLHDERRLADGIARRRTRCDGHGPVVADRGLGGIAHPFTPEPRFDWMNWRWKMTKMATAGSARTTAPARIEPYGFAALDATVEM